MEIHILPSLLLNVTRKTTFLNTNLMKRCWTDDITERINHLVHRFAFISWGTQSNSYGQNRGCGIRGTIFIRKSVFLIFCRCPKSHLPRDQSFRYYYLYTDKMKWIKRRYTWTIFTFAHLKLINIIKKNK